MIPKQPKITVVTVCYNCVTEIEDTIKSVIAQSYKDLEYIVIDGASNDGTLDIINKYKNNINVIVSEHDKGIYDAMNKGIELATGEWINFMNAGDTFFNKDSIKDFFSIADVNSPNDILYGDTILVYPLGLYYKDCHPDDQKEHWCHQSMFIRTSIMKQYRYDLKYKVRADYNFIYQATHHGSKMSYYPTAVACYKNYDGLSTTRYDIMMEDTYMIEGKKKDFLYWYYKLYYFMYNKLHIRRFWVDKEKEFMESVNRNTRLRKL